MNLRAVYLPDLAFDPKDGNRIFEYDFEVNKFKMMLDEEIQYWLEDVIEDENFLVLKTNLSTDSWYPYGKGDSVISGEVEIIDKKDIKCVIEKIKEHYR